MKTNLNALKDGLTLLQTFRAKPGKQENGIGNQLRQVIANKLNPSSKPEQPPIADNHPTKLYATVKVNGVVAGEFFNGGIAVLMVEPEGGFTTLPGFANDEPLVGPVLAQKRAESYAKAVGGTIELAPTAQNQLEWQLGKAIKMYA